MKKKACPFAVAQIILLVNLSMTLSAWAENDQGYGYDIHCGMRNIFTLSGEMIAVPLYLANFEEIGIYSCSFTVSISSPCSLIVQEVTTETGIAAGWAVATQKKSYHETAVILESAEDFSSVAPGAGALYYGSGELVICKLVIQSGSQLPAVSDISLVNITMETEQGTVTIEPLVRKVKPQIAQESIRFGDVDLNRQIQLDDAHAILTYAIADDFTGKDEYGNLISINKADVYTDGIITVYDAALVSLHGIGLVAELPINASLVPSSGLGRVNVELGTPQPLSTPDLYQYRLKGSNVSGLVSAQAEFILDPEVIKQIKPPTTTTIKGARIIGNFNPATNVYRVGLITNDKVEAYEKDLFVLNVQHNPGYQNTGLYLKNVIVNEQTFLAFDSSSFRAPAGSDMVSLPRPNKGFNITPANHSGMRTFRIANNSENSFTLSLFSLNGELICSRRYGRGTVTAGFSSGNVSSGTYFLVLKSSTVTFTRMITLGK
ncbi:MAG: hypothetical protein GF401_08040 [Chitinivibrionales bacterium]|nr:hypothetical protein [Chitinivibrionales bacterium]